MQPAAAVDVVCVISYLPGNMRRPILIHPDPRLRKVCKPITEIDDEVRALADEMLATMYEANGLGLAAPQIGVTRRLFVMDCASRDEDAKPDPVCVINPEIVSVSEETVEREEGCLSIPEIFTNIERPEAVRLRFIDQHGTEHEQDFDGIRARCVQHEVDHLNGKLFIDYISAMRRQMITSKMKKLKREKARA